MPKQLPVIDEKDRPYGMSGYSGTDAKELARQASLHRPIELTEELFLTFCDRLIEGEPMVRICADQTMPSRPQIMRYMHKNSQAKELYYAAREMQAETLAEEMMIIASDDSNDWSIDPKTGRRISHSDVVSRSKLRTDAILKVLGSIAPRRFGNRTTTEVSGDPSKPMTLQIVTGVNRNADSLIPSGLPVPKIIEGEVVKKSIKDE